MAAEGVARKSGPKHFRLAKSFLEFSGSLECHALPREFENSLLL